MKKLLLVCSVSVLFSVSAGALASDKAIAFAWSGASESIARMINTPTLRAVAASMSDSAMTAASIFVGRGQHALAKSSGTALDAQDKAAIGAACPICPVPPCD